MDLDGEEVLVSSEIPQDWVQDDDSFNLKLSSVKKYVLRQTGDQSDSSPVVDAVVKLLKRERGSNFDNEIELVKIKRYENLKSLMIFNIEKAAMAARNSQTRDSIEECEEMLWYPLHDDEVPKHIITEGINMAKIQRPTQVNLGRGLHLFRRILPYLNYGDRMDVQDKTFKLILCNTLVSRSYFPSTWYRNETSEHLGPPFGFENIVSNNGDVVAVFSHTRIYPHYVVEIKVKHPPFTYQKTLPHFVPPPGFSQIQDYANKAVADVNKPMTDSEKTHWNVAETLMPMSANSQSSPLASSRKLTITFRPVPATQAQLDFEYNNPALNRTYWKGTNRTPGKSLRDEESAFFSNDDSTGAVGNADSDDESYDMRRGGGGGGASSQKSHSPHQPPPMPRVPMFVARAVVLGFGTSSSASSNTKIPDSKRFWDTPTISDVDKTRLIQKALVLLPSAFPHRLSTVPASLQSTSLQQASLQSASAVPFKNLDLIMLTNTGVTSKKKAGLNKNNRKRYIMALDKDYGLEFDDMGFILPTASSATNPVAVSIGSSSSGGPASGAAAPGPSRLFPGSALTTVERQTARAAIENHLGLVVIPSLNQELNLASSHAFDIETIAKHGVHASEKNGKISAVDQRFVMIPIINMKGILVPNHRYATRVCTWPPVITDEDSIQIGYAFHKQDKRKTNQFSILFCDDLAKICPGYDPGDDFQIIGNPDFIMNQTVPGKLNGTLPPSLRYGVLDPNCDWKFYVPIFRKIGPNAPSVFSHYCVLIYNKLSPSYSPPSPKMQPKRQRKPKAPVMPSHKSSSSSSSSSSDDANQSGGDVSGNDDSDDGGVSIVPTVQPVFPPAPPAAQGGKGHWTLWGSNPAPSSGVDPGVVLISSDDDDVASASAAGSKRPRPVSRRNQTSIGDLNRNIMSDDLQPEDIEFDDMEKQLVIQAAVDGNASISADWLPITFPWLNFHVNIPIIDRFTGDQHIRPGIDPTNPQLCVILLNNRFLIKVPRPGMGGAASRRRAMP